MPKYRMIHVDHYMSKPIDPFDDCRSEISTKSTSKVPVIRIFGADADGHKICLHVHGYYPYVAIQNRFQSEPNIEKKLISDIERAIAEVAVREKRPDQTAGASQNNVHPPQQEPPQPAPIPAPATDEDSNLDEETVLRQRLLQERKVLKNPGMDQNRPIHRIEKLMAYNYYGYHHEQEEFFKLHLYNPRMVKHLATIFEDGRVLSRFIPVFWAHLPYILLFFIDNNLRGMQFIDVEQIYWRKGRQPRQEQSETIASTSDDSGPNHLTADIEPTSSCELEADIRFEWILNRQRFGTKGNDDALRELWLDDQESSQASSLIDQKLPLYNLERNYVRQLCEAYNVDCKLPDADLPPSQSRPSQPPTPSSTSENSLYYLRDIESEIEIEFDDDDDFPPRPVVKQETPIASTSTLETKPNPNAKDWQDVQPRSISQHSSGSTKETVSHEYQYFCLMSMELHVTTRGKLRPDPAFDPIEAIFYCVRNDTPETSNKPLQVVGMIVTDIFNQNFQPSTSYQAGITSPGSKSSVSFIQKLRSLMQKTGLSLDDLEMNVVETELELIMTLVDMVKLHDPEILLGYEMEMLSWGYVLERSNFLNINISTPLSRVAESYLGNNSKYVESTFVQPIMFTGRMVFSVWRIIRHEVNLTTCSFERIYHHALNERIPCYFYDTLTKWFTQNRNRWRVIDYYLMRVVGQMRILEKFDLITKVSELARVYGTQFIDVITRGSQIGIESMMLRLAKLGNLVPLSPTVMQRNKMKAPEALPLVMEPETNIYYDPVAVLDFQSLYPSVVIAYNYCYSTCLGRVIDLETKEPHSLGCSQLHVKEAEIKRLLSSNSVHIAPCGVAYVKKNIRHGVLPKMLSELILTRAMVKDQMKKNMKSDKPNRRLQRILDHRQHGLKMMANTTYGYAGASYTGRMPCVEIADSIVSKGRETLENAIELVESRSEWGAKVIYGDTDSMFIKFEGCDRETAFKRAFEMVEAITEANPHPIKMKFEKIYQPCVLQTKKRYCGFKYESPDQTRPDFEAKGIETVRRDCCPAAAKMLEMALRIQFTTRDVSQVKKFVQHQFIKIMSGKLSNMQDFIFARQYKPRDLEKTESVFVPAWQITKRLLSVDPRAEPRFKERVPFVIIYGEPKTPLVNLAKTPMEVLENTSYRVNAEYYIAKIICPTLNRVFCTLNEDTLLWYKSMPHGTILHRSHYLVAQKKSATKQSTMSQYFSPSHCPVCAKSIPVSDDICDDCRNDKQASVIRLSEEITRNQRKLLAYHQLCKACSSLERCDNDSDEFYNPCISYDCHNLFRYHQAKLDALNSNFLTQILKNLY